MLASSSGFSVTMAGGGKPQQQRFKLSLSFLNRKKEMKNGLSLPPPPPPPPKNDFPQVTFVHGVALQDIAEENEDNITEDHEENLDIENSNDSDDGELMDDHDDDESLHLVPKSSSPRHVHPSLSPLRHKSSDIPYPPTSPSSRRVSRASKGYDASNNSGHPRGEVNSQISTDLGCKGFFKSRCGLKLTDVQNGVHSGRLGTVRKHRKSLALSKEPIAREREASLRMFADEENDMVTKVVHRRRRGQRKTSNHIVPSPGFSPTLCVHAATSDLKCSVRDAYAELRGSTEFAQLPDQLKIVEIERIGDNHMRTVSSEFEANGSEQLAKHWERSYPSSDDGMFTTSCEVEGQDKKPRRNKWSSNSSDDSEGRDRRSGRSNNRPSERPGPRLGPPSVMNDDDYIVNHKTRGRKGSRIIFLSTPPRIDSVTKELSSERILPTGYKTKVSREFSPLLEGDLEASAKAWQALDLRSMHKAEDDSDVSGMDQHFVHMPGLIDSRVEDQIGNLKLESDSSASSEEVSFSSAGSRRCIKPGQSEQEKPSRKKRGSRRRKGRRSKAAPPLPGDLQGKVKESVAVVKSSYDPYQDFRDSMVEMIVEKEIQGANDLEELLRCYLSLNDEEYHSVIVKVFADVWRELFAENIC